MHRSISAGGLVLARRAARLLVCSAAAAAAMSGSATAARPLTLGVDAIGPAGSPDPTVRDPWIAKASADGAQRLRVPVPWSSVAPKTKPSGFVESDPASPYYSWSATDALVRSAADHGLSILMLLESAPSWAEGPGRPSSSPPGSWKPDAGAFAQFARAAATRYSGHFPDPLNPSHSLPRVRYWEAWNEPNLWLYVTPQWIRSKGRWVAESPIIYRNLVNAFYGAVKAVSRSNQVVAGGTAPFGDLHPGQLRIQPVPFIRDLLCLRGPRLRSSGCRVHFDVLDHHPFDIAGPLHRALNPGDVSVPDMGKLTRLIRGARRAHTLLPRGGKKVWATELVWSSKPPDPQGVPIERQAHWIEQAFYELWHEGVSSVFWLQIVDDSTPGGLDSGLYYANGSPKPAVTAFAFPFVTVRQKSQTTRAWGRAPASGTLLLQQLKHKRWVTVRRLKVHRFATFYVPLRVRGRVSMRAQIGPQTSLVWP